MPENDLLSREFATRTRRAQAAPGKSAEYLTHASRGRNTGARWRGAAARNLGAAAAFTRAPSRVPAQNWLRFVNFRFRTSILTVAHNIRTSPMSAFARLTSMPAACQQIRRPRSDEALD